MADETKNLTAPPPTSSVDSALRSALRTDMRPFRAPDFSQIKTSRDVLAEQSRIIPEVAQAEASFKEAEMAQQSMLAGEKARGLERVASDAKARIAKTQADEATFPYPEFHPTKENAQSLGELFSMMSTVGVMLGGAGKLSSLNALNAMGGMLKGWQAGRADLFKREKETFDKEFQRIKSIRENLRKDLDDYMKLLPYDKEAAMYKAEEITRKAGSNSIIAAYMAKQQPEMALKLLDSAGKVIQHKEDRDARERQHRESLASQERLRQATLDAANIRAAMKASAGEPKASISQMKSGKEKNEMIGKASALGAFDFVINEVEKDPSLVGVIGAARRVGSGASQIPGLGGLADPQVTYIQSFIEAAKTKDYRSFVGSGALSDRDKQNLDKIFATTPLNSAADVKAAFLAAKNILASSLIGAGFDANKEADVYSKSFSESYGKMSGKPQTAPDTRIYEPKTEEEFNALKPGSLYIDPSDRKQYRKP